MTSAQEPAKDGEPLSPAQVRRRLGITRRTLQRWVASGRTKPDFRLPNGHARWLPATVDALLTPGDKGAERPA